MRRITAIVASILGITTCCMAQQMRTACFEGMPEGTYALSVSDVVAHADSTTIFGKLKPYTAYEIDSLRKAYPQKLLDYETEQVISGRVKGSFGKVKRPLLHVFVPQTGYKDTYDMENKQRFHLRGMDFVDGTEYVLQVTRPSGSHNLIQLYVDDVLFPDISVRAFRRELGDSCLFADKGMQEYARKMDEYSKSIELPDIIVKGKRIKSMRFGIDPAKGYGVNDEMLTKGYTMEYLITRLGFQIGHGDGKAPYQWRPVFDGWKSSTRWVVPTIFIDDFILESYEIEELWNIQSESVKQIEYYPPEDSFNHILLKGSEAGTLCIYTKPHAKSAAPLSMVRVRQIGYQPERTFSASYSHGATVVWNPALRVGEDGKASVSFEAVEGKQYKVVLEGVSDKGVRVRKEATL